MKKNKVIKFFGVLFFVLSLGGLLSFIAAPLDARAADVNKSIPFNPQVAIPGSSFQNSIAIGNDSIGRYVVAVYNYGLTIVGILAALVLMAGGLIWLTSGGNTSKISQAKELMTGSIIGIVILTGTWLILNTINPKLTRFEPLKGIDVINELIIGSCCEYPDWTAKINVPKIDCEGNQGRFYPKAKVTSKADGSGAFCADTGCCRCKLGGSWNTLWFSDSTCVDEKNGGGKVLPDMCGIACEAAGDASHASWEVLYVWGQGCDEGGDCSWGAEGGAGGDF